MPAASFGWAIPATVQQSKNPSDPFVTAVILKIWNLQRNKARLRIVQTRTEMWLDRGFPVPFFLLGSRLPLVELHSLWILLGTHARHEESIKGAWKDCGEVESPEQNMKK